MARSSNYQLAMVHCRFNRCPLVSYSLSLSFFLFGCLRAVGSQSGKTALDFATQFGYTAVAALLR